MESSTEGAAKRMPAANILTLMVLPNRRGVLMRTSAAKCSQPLTERTLAWSLAKLPGGSVFQNVRVQAFWGI